MVLSVRISLKISAAECPASANNEEEWNTTPATAFTRTNARFTSLQVSSLLGREYNPIRVIRTPGFEVSFETRRVLSWS